MHSRDPNKKPELFQQEIEAILAGTSHWNPKDKSDFTRFVFPAVDSRMRRFRLPACFDHAKFTHAANFHGARFTRGATFCGAVFDRETKFWMATFIQDADFSHATFTQAVNFELATFMEGANFGQATFTQGADFWGAAFTRDTDFRWSTFRRPDLVLFHQVSQGKPFGFRARFLNCPIEEVKFIDVNWPRHKGRMVLQDELDVRFEPEKYADFELVAVAYRQLVNNFEKTRNYGLAEDCFIGAMEMTRLDPRNFILARWPPVGNLYGYRWARKLGEWFSVLNLYRLLSKYGSSYTRALEVLGLIVLIHALLFPLFGLQTSGKPDSQALSLAAPAMCPDQADLSWCNALSSPEPLKQLPATFIAGLWMALEVGSFQRRPTLEPATLWGRRLAVVETILIPGQLALVLLALRRRFRR
jgi:hypothetical protein